jgi:cyanoexosortase A
MITNNSTALSPRKFDRTFSSLKLSSVSQMGLWGLTILLSLIDLVEINRLNLSHLFTLHLLVMIAIANSLNQKKQKIFRKSDVFSICLGGTIIALTLLRSQMPLGYHTHLSLFVFGIGLALISIGRKHIFIYYKELISLGILALNPIFHRLLIAFNWQVLTAQASTLMLNFFRINATQQANLVVLPTGRVEVYGSCAGSDLTILLVMIVTLFLLQFPLKIWQGFCCYLIAIALAFVINSLRIALLAVLIAQHNFKSFDYWHGDGGGWIFALITIAIWGLCCWYAFIKPNLAKTKSI